MQPPLNAIQNGRVLVVAPAAPIVPGNQDGSVGPIQRWIRQTAREKKKERFTALFHHINVELLRDAFFAIRREAAPGVGKRFRF
jgi:hypothetical protein